MGLAECHFHCSVLLLVILCFIILRVLIILNNIAILLSGPRKRRVENTLYFLFLESPGTR